MSRPAGRAASAPAVRKIAGPRPRIPSMPVTRTSVTVATATASWTMPERHVRVAASRTVFRRIGKPSTSRPYPSAAASPARNAAAPPREGWRTYGPPMRACAILPIAIARRPSESSARNGALASISARVGGRFELSVPGCVGTTFQRRTSLSIPSSAEHRVDDGRGRLGRTGAGELALRGQGDARDARPAIAGRLGDEQERALLVSRADRRQGGRAGAAEPAYWLNVSPILAAASRSTKLVFIALA